MMNISEISMLAMQSVKNLNTLNGVNHIQWSAGFQSAINNVYYEANRYKDISAFLDEKGLIALAEFCSNTQERISLSGDDKFAFLDGLHAGYQVAKDKINQSLS